MTKAEEIFEELISTIERNAIDNKATITNVKTWVGSWRNEMDLALNMYSVGVPKGTLCECGGNERIALDCTMKPCKHPKYCKE